MNKQEMLDKATALIKSGGKSPKGRHWIVIGNETGEMELLDVKTIQKSGKLAVHESVGRFVVSDLSCGLAIASFRVKTRARAHATLLGTKWSAQDMLAEFKF